MKQADIAVVGSINLDLVFSVPQLPSLGETVTGAGYGAYAGGKGANQAVAAARMGAAVAMIGCVGDENGRDLKLQLEQEGINCSNISTVPGPSGCAGIIVDTKGDNLIAVADGANGRLSAELVCQASDLIAKAKILLVQLEVPLDAVSQAVRVARDAGTTVILDPAPARMLPGLMEQLDFITPNAPEASVLTGIDVHCWKTAALAARELRRQGVKHVLVTMGKFGAFYSSQIGEVRITAPLVDAVDSTAAGDAFNGALAAALVQGADPDQAADIAAVAGALAASVHGAQSSLPRLEQVVKVVDFPWLK